MAHRKDHRKEWLRPFAIQMGMILTVACPNLALANGPLLAPAPTFKVLRYEATAKKIGEWAISEEVNFGVPRECRTTMSPSADIRPLCETPGYYRREVATPLCRQGFASQAFKTTELRADTYAKINCSSARCEQVATANKEFGSRSRVTVMEFNSYIRGGETVWARVVNGGELTPDCNCNVIRYRGDTQCIELRRVQGIFINHELIFYDELPTCPPEFKLKDGICVGKSWRIRD